MYQVRCLFHLRADGMKAFTGFKCDCYELAIGLHSTALNLQPLPLKF